MTIAVDNNPPGIPSESERRIATAVRSLLPSPFKNDGLPESEELIERARRILRIGPDDRSAAAKLRILEYLSNEMTSLALPAATSAEVRTRLGERGQLPDRLYDVLFEDAFSAIAGNSVVARELIILTIHEPTAVQHMLPDRLITADGLPLVSLYARSIRPRKLENFVLLVLSMRRGATQVPLFAWRVFHADVSYPTGSDPLTILRALVDRYGLEITTPIARGRKFILYEAIPIPPGASEVRVIEFDRPPGSQADITHSMRFIPGVAVEIAVAFAINATQYLADQRRHRSR